MIQYLICLIDKHGIDILRTTKNKNHSKLEKEIENLKVTKIYTYTGLKRTEIAEATAGDIIAVVGIAGAVVFYFIKKRKKS